MPLTLNDDELRAGAALLEIPDDLVAALMSRVPTDRHARLLAVTTTQEARMDRTLKDRVELLEEVVQDRLRIDLDEYVAEKEARDAAGAEHEAGRVEAEAERERTPESDE